MRFLLREVTSRSYKTRLFVAAEPGPPMHISRLYGTVVKEISLSEGVVEYSVEPEAPLVVYEVFLDGGAAGCRMYRLSTSGLEPVEAFDGIPHVTSGYRAVDKAVEEAHEYRSYWSQKLCGTPEGPRSFYRAQLAASGALNYALYKRLKELWLESSREYTVFVFAVVLEALQASGCTVEAVGREICEQALSAESANPRGLSAVLNCGGARAVVEVEKRVGRAHPDIFAKTGRRAVIVECKHGPPKTWLAKALRQAAFYKELGEVLVLATPRGPARGEVDAIKQYYDVVECSPRNADFCIERFKSIFKSN
ncbi:MAG: hypothetical protein ACP5KA_03995 [Desulfurococcaceae archaeon]